MGFREEPAALATSKDFYKQLLWTIETVAPLVQFLNEPLVGAQQTERRAHVFGEDELSF
jgi:hypothetical protein